MSAPSRRRPPRWYSAFFLIVAVGIPYALAIFLLFASNQTLPVTLFASTCSVLAGTWNLVRFYRRWYRST